MAFTDVIARLAVSLNLDTAGFQTGARKAKVETNNLQGHMKKVAGAIGAAFAGIGIGEAIEAYREMTKQAINSANSISRLAQVANASGAEFQRMAYGAQTVGIESDKLADIYKDVNDKIGDFIANGGGEMADFFTNVAPKVGVTAAQFEKLSGPQALQLYVSSLEKAGLSQQQMTFYMEALANDATLLLPLLKNNGAEMGRFAKAADDLGIVLSDADIAKAAELAEQMAKLNTQIEAQQNKKLLENADAVLKYEQGIGDLKLALIDAVVVVQGWGEALDTATIATHDALTGMADAIDAQLHRWRESIIGAANEVGSFVSRAASGFAAIPGFVSRMVSQVKAEMLGRLTGIWDAAKAKIDSVRQAFFDMWDKVTRRSYVPDMVDDIAREMGRLDGVMVSPATAAASAVTRSMREMARETADLLDRLFPEVRQLLDYRKDLATLDAAKLDPATDAAARGRLARQVTGTDGAVPVTALNDNTALDVTKGLDDVMERLDTFGKKAGSVTVNVAKSFKDMADATLSSLQSLAGAVKGGGFLDILSAVVGFGLQLGSIGAFGKTIAGRINAPKVPGYAGGTNFHPGGLAIVGERGPELVDMPRGSRVTPNCEWGGGRLQVEVAANNNGFGAVIRNHAGQVVAEAMPATISASAQVAQSQMAYRNTRRVA